MAIPHADRWRRLHGDEIGALVADFVLDHCAEPAGALLVTTVASSTLARPHGGGRRRALHGDADRLQVDDARAGARAAAAARCEEALGYLEVVAESSAEAAERLAALREELTGAIGPAVI